MVHPISGKTVVVTGGSRGIGLGLVTQLLQQQNFVITTTTKTPASAAALHALTVPEGSHLHILQLDISSIDSIVAWVHEVKALKAHLDVVINNAGIAIAEPSMLDANEDHMVTQYKVNALGPFFVTQQLYKAGLLGGEKPTLICQVSTKISSLGDTTFPLNGYYGYRASKTALNMLNKLLIQDLHEHNVELLVMDPGYVDTDMNGHSGPLTVTESAHGILAVLESGQKLVGKFFSYDGTEVVW